MADIVGGAFGGAFLSASVDALVEMIVSRKFFDFFRKSELDQVLLDDVERELLRLNSVLRNAGEKQFTDDLVKKWLNMLQDIVFQAEDLFDEINTEALRCYVEADQVVGLKDIECLDWKWLQHLTSLCTLKIDRAPKLKSLPENEELPSSLKKIHINECPLLEANLEKMGW